MRIKEILHSCTVDNINIVLINYKPDYTKIETKIRNKKHFRNFIETYGNSVVYKWAIESEDGIPYMVFDLKKLVTYDKPTTREELLEIINQTIEEKGFECDLNFIDVSNIEDMNWLFAYSSFNGDISKWDVSKVENMSYMFCESQFNGNISDWDIKNVTDRRFMFQNCPLAKNPPEWY